MGIYKRQYVVLPHKLHCCHIDQRMDQCMNNWYRRDCLNIRHHFDIHRERNAKVDFQCNQGNRCKLKMVKKKFANTLNCKRILIQESSIYVTWSFTSGVIMARITFGILKCKPNSIFKFQAFYVHLNKHSKCTYRSAWIVCTQISCKHKLKIFILFHKRSNYTKQMISVCIKRRFEIKLRRETQHWLLNLAKIPAKLTLNDVPGVKGRQLTNGSPVISRGQEQIGVKPLKLQSALTPVHV